MTWTDGRTDGQTVKRTDWRTNRQMGGLRLSEWDASPYGKDRRTDLCTDRQTGLGFQIETWVRKDDGRKELEHRDGCKSNLKWMIWDLEENLWKVSDTKNSYNIMIKLWILWHFFVISIQSLDLRIQFPYTKHCPSPNAISWPSSSSFIHHCRHHRHSSLSFLFFVTLSWCTTRE